jgi:hypothetical protein
VGRPEEGGIEYQHRVVLYTREPYEFQRSYPTEIITAITCVPVDTATQSPEADVIEGGLNHNHVTIRLTPVWRGKWGCKLSVRAHEIGTGYGAARWRNVGAACCKNR